MLPLSSDTFFNIFYFFKYFCMEYNLEIEYVIINMICTFYTWVLINIIIDLYFGIY